MKFFNLCWLIPILVLCFPKTLVASPNQSALLSITQKLHCANTERDSQALLSMLMSIPKSPFGIPSDNFEDNEQNFLYAATVDILLQQLLETSRRFPNLQESVERTALLWDFCEIMSEGELVDLMINSDNEIIKQSAVKPFPAKKQGFSLWGFLNPDPKNRHVPKILDIPTFPLAQQSLLFRIFVKQCFPHPDTGRLFTELKESERIGKLRMKKEFKLGKKYPYQWEFDCEKKLEPLQIVEQRDIVEIEPELEIEPVIELETIIEQKIEKVIQESFKPESLEEKIPEPSLDENFSLGLNTDNELGLHLQPELESIDNQQTKVDRLFKPYTEPTKDDGPIISVTNQTGGSSNGGPLPLPPKDGYGFSGNVYHSSPLAGTLSVGANVSWTPHSYFFIRGGVNYKYYPDDDVLSYSWGIGYDDWHPGTFSFQLNNWGPILPGEGLAFDKAIADIGYKFKAEFLKPYKIAGSASFVIPVTGDQQITTTWSWAPFEYWFVRVSFQVKPFNYDGVTWSYGFGYSDWHPFTVGLAYNNWGPNSLTDDKGDGVNFKDNGLVSLSFGWAF
ncbi:MAG: hypothetical protein KAH20_05650 [Methylococcales bacterium]|nr:hypothetical protein [Methylococcales bacterium]